jgi:hypothetical protein
MFLFHWCFLTVDGFRQSLGLQQFRNYCFCFELFKKNDLKVSLLQLVLQLSHRSSHFLNAHTNSVYLNLDLKCC